MIIDTDEYVAMQSSVMCTSVDSLHAACSSV